jgi:hypothetical protein
MKMRTALAAALLLAPATLAGQGAAPHITIADREHAAGRVTSSYRHLEMAITAEPTNYEALWKASRDAVALGENEADATRRDALYRSGEQYARRAVSANPADAEGHFSLARALGRTAQTLGSRDRVKYAGEVREHALQALRADPQHGGALHVMGVWNAEIMRLSSIQRFAARNLLGGKVFGEASWAEARRYMEAAVAAEPNRITHHLDLGVIYADIGETAKAREQFALVARIPASEPNDAKYKREAAAHSARLR